MDPSEVGRANWGFWALRRGKGGNRGRGWGAGYMIRVLECRLRVWLGFEASGGGILFGKGLK